MGEQTFKINQAGRWADGDRAGCCETDLWPPLFPWPQQLRIRNSGGSPIHLTQTYTCSGKTSEHPNRAQLTPKNVVGQLGP